LPRSRSPSGPTNPRNKPQTIPKLKRNSRSEGVSNSAQAQADGPRGGGGRSARSRRTVRKSQQNLQYCTLKNGWSASNWCYADSPQRPDRRSAKPLLAKLSWQNKSKRRHSRTRDEREEHPAEMLLADYPPAFRRRSSRHGNNSPSLKPQEPNHLSFHKSPK
jgi:hypothetical protein